MKQSGAKKILFLVLFIVYVVVLVYLLFFSDAYGRTAAQEDYRFNFIPFREISRYLFRVSDPGLKVLNLLGNILIFVPFGFFVPMLYPDLQKWWVVLLNTLSFSACVKVVQLVTMTGTFDVDDLMLNTAGGVLGWLLFYLIFLRKGKNGKTEAL